MNFSKQHDSFSVQKLLDMNKAGKLNLNPGFQRLSVWGKKDRQMLIDTILRGMAVEALHLLVVGTAGTRSGADRL